MMLRFCKQWLWLGLCCLSAASLAAPPEPITEAVAVPRPVLEEAAFGFETTAFEVHYVDSQGLFRDFFARLARGGEQADRLRARLRNLSKGGGGPILVYSPNPGLGYTVLKNALPEADADWSLSGVTIGYAGHKGYGEKLCERICDGDGVFVFIDTEAGNIREPARTEPE